MPGSVIENQGSLVSEWQGKFNGHSVDIINDFVTRGRFHHLAGRYSK